MGDEDRVVMVKRRFFPVAHGSTGHMCDGIVAHHLDHVFIARQHAVGRQRKGLVGRFRAHAREHVRDRAALMVATLGAHMVERRAIGHVDLHALVEPRGGGSVFQHRDIGPRLNTDKMVQRGIRGLIAVQVDQADGPCGPGRGANDDAVGGACGVQRRQRTVHRGLATRFQHTVEVPGPMDVGLENIGKPFDFNAVHGEVVGLIRIEHAIHEHDLQPVDIPEERCLVRPVEQCRRGCRPGSEMSGSGVFPILVPPRGQPCGPHASQRRIACVRGPRGLPRRARRGRQAAPRSGPVWLAASAITPPPRGCRHSRSSRPQAPVPGRRSSRCGRRP
jgi:hypothetical protein